MVHFFTVTEVFRVKRVVADTNNNITKNKIKSIKFVDDMCRSALSTAYQSYTHIFILFHFFFTLYSKPWTLEPKNALVHLALCLQHPAKTDALLDLSQVRQKRGGH